MNCYKTKVLTTPEVIELCQREESHFFDHKSAGVDGKKIQKIATAFANADGGEFIIGIADKKEDPNPLTRWQGKKDTESFNSIFQSLSEISPTIPYYAEFLKAPDDTIALSIQIEKGTNVYSTSSGDVYIRQSAQSILIKDPEKIQSLSFSKGVTSFEDKIINDSTAEDIENSEEIRNFLQNISPSTDAKTFLKKQNLLDKKTGTPKAAGVLLFCDDPTPIFPTRCAIKIARYDTSEQTPEREHLKEQRTIEGSLNNQVIKASKAVKEIMDAIQIMGKSGLEKVNYPPETIWEILVNAVIHRDYSISDDVQIQIFNNRIVIKSPGRLPGFVTIDNILESRFSRNSKIVRILNRYKNPINKDMGEGLNTAFQKMQEFRLHPPIIKEEGNYVSVTIPHTPLASPEEQVLEFLDKNKIIRNREAREITGIRSENVMKRVFYSLRDQNLIDPVMSKTGNRIVAWTKKTYPV
ncbi:MAG: ATP-binding protein [Brachymonas sp.]|nr:ATP-binding protein [Brachymonas sp.]